MKALIARKLGMTTLTDDSGAIEAVTLLSVQPNTVTQIKSIEKDGYSAVQLSAGENKKLSKAQLGHFKAAKVKPSFTREFRITETVEEIAMGNTYDADSFEVGDIVKVTGVSKGKGWAGTIKRHNFQRGRKTHGGRSYRRVGSIGSMYPQKIFKGKKMSGRMGEKQVTTKNLRVALVDKELQVVGITGSIPGPKRGVVIIQGSAR